jgi:hypothetical protein
LRQVHAAVAIFAGWASIPLGAVAGLAAMQLLGLNVVDRPLPLETVYGISAAIILWVFVAAAVLTAIPLARAVLAMGPSERVNRTAAVMAVIGVVLLPDELGRVFGFPILAGAAAMAYGGRQMLLEAATRGANATAGTATQLSGQRPTWIFDAVELAGDATPDPTTASTAMAVAVAVTGSGSPALSEAAPGHPEATREIASEIAAEMTCQWCSAAVPVDATICLICNAPLNGPDSQSMTIPGVTEVSPELRAYAARARPVKKGASLLIAMFSDTPVPQTIDPPPPSDAAALRPPSRELRAEMARLDAEIAAGRADFGDHDASDIAAGPPGATAGATPEPRT